MKEAMKPFRFDNLVERVQILRIKRLRKIPLMARWREAYCLVPALSRGLAS
jgi:hypothetical protein